MIIVHPTISQGTNGIADDVATIDGEIRRSALGDNTGGIFTARASTIDVLQLARPAVATQMPTTGSPSNVRAFSIKALPTNAGIIWLGHNNLVTPLTGYPLSPGEAIEMAIENLNMLWTFAAVANDDLAVITLRHQ